MTNPTSYHIITVEIPDDESDATIGILYNNGCLGIEENTGKAGHTKLKAYFDEDGRTLSAFINEIREIVPHISDITGTSIDINSSVFKPITFEPFELIPNYWIVPPADMPTEEKAPADVRQIIIRPGMAFGTGRHESTQLAAGNIEFCSGEHKVRPYNLLDIGTGSGILAIVAKLLGVSQVDAIDIDPHSLENARENFELNSINDIRLFDDLANIPVKNQRAQRAREGGSVGFANGEGDASPCYDIVVANILAPTIIHLKNDILSHCKPGGHLIFSGIVKDEIPQIEEAFKDIELVQKTTKNEWVSFLYKV